VGEVPAVRASVGCGYVEFCLVWTPLASATLCATNPTRIDLGLNPDLRD
jgi:hypothetical protein